MSDGDAPANVFNILLVEDNPADIVLAEEVFSEVCASARIHAAKDGHAALSFLRKESPHGEAPTPELILLDLNLPGMDGLQVLQIVKTDPVLKRLPVICLTSSQSEEDRRNAYEHHANAFMLKASTLDGAIAIAKSILDYWAKMVSLPPK